MFNDAQYSLRFLKNLTHFNIALSRAKNRLIIINFETITEHQWQNQSIQAWETLLMHFQQRKTCVKARFSEGREMQNLLKISDSLYNEVLAHLSYEN